MSVSVHTHNVSITTNSTVLDSNVGIPFPFMVASAGVSFLMILENIAGMLVILFNPSLHTTANVFVCSMGVTDFVAALAFFLANILNMIDDLHVFPSLVFFPHVMSLIMIVYTFVNLSMTHMAVIAIERYVYIAHPFFYRRHTTNDTVARILVVYWMTSAGYVIAFFGVYLSQRDPVDCSIPDFVGHGVGGFIYGASALLSAIAYARIIVIAVERNRTKSAKTKHLVQKEESWKSTLKVIKFFTLVYGVFLILTLPSYLVLAVDRFIVKVSENVITALSAPRAIVPAVNFLILTGVNVDFRAAIRMTFSCKTVKSVK